jgi:putative acetyltransferase
VIREYRPGDSPELLTTWYESAQVAHPFWPPERFARERQQIRDVFLHVAETWVFEEGGHVVGFVAMMEREVGGLFVAPQSQRKGIGWALLDHVRGPRDYLELDVFRENRVGRAFYDRYGFEVVGERQEEASGLDILRLRLEC